MNGPKGEMSVDFPRGWQVVQLMITISARSSHNAALLKTLYETDLAESDRSIVWLGLLP